MKKTQYPIRNSFNLAIGCLAIIVVLPFLVATAGDSREEHRDRIRRMTQSEREQLDHNFKLYLELTGGQRESIKTLHQRVEDNPRLRKTLNNFCNWFRKLSVDDKNRIRDETDPRKRMQIVSELRKQQLEGESDRDWSRLLSGSTRMKREDFERVGNIVHENFDKVLRAFQHDAELSREQRAELERQKPFERQVSILRASIQGTENWPDGALRLELLEIVDDPRFTELMSDDDEKAMRQKLFLLLYRALMRNWRDEAEKIEVGNEEVLEWTKQNDPKLHEVLLSSSADRALDWARYEYKRAKIGGHQQLGELARELGMPWFLGGPRGRPDWRRGRRPGDDPFNRSPGDRERGRSPRRILPKRE